MNKLLVALALAALGLLAQAANAQAQPLELAGVKFEPQVAVAGKPLQLNGAGIRYKAIVKVYAVGLYLPSKASSFKAISELPGPKRVHAVMLRDVSGSELGKSFTKSYQESASKEDFMSSITQIARLGEVLSARRQIKEGESFSFDWVPGQGTFLLINGESVGEPFAGAAFFSGMLKLWIGDADSAGVRDALLGQTPKRNTRSRDNN